MLYRLVVWSCGTVWCPLAGPGPLRALWCPFRSDGWHYRQHCCPRPSKTLYAVNRKMYNNDPLKDIYPSDFLQRMITWLHHLPQIQPERRGGTAIQCWKWECVWSLRSHQCWRECASLSPPSTDAGLPCLSRQGDENMPRFDRLARLYARYTVGTEMPSSKTWAYRGWCH